MTEAISGVLPENLSTLRFRHQYIDDNGFDSDCDDVYGNANMERRWWGDPSVSIPTRNGNRRIFAPNALHHRCCSVEKFATVLR